MRRFEQSLSAYWVHSRSSFVGGGVFWAGVVFSVMMLIPPRTGSVAVTLVGMTLAGLMLWLHFREQVMHPFRRTFPGFAGPQLGAFLLLSAGIWIGFPLLLAGRQHISPLGVLAIALAVAAIEGWWVLTMSWVLTIGLTVAWMTLFSGSAIDILENFARGGYPQAAQIILAGSVFAIAAAILCMLRLTEEHPWYKRSVQFRTDLRERMTGDTANVWAQSYKQFSIWPTRTPSTFPAATDTGWRARHRRWRAISPGNVKMNLMMSVFLTLSMLLPVYRQSDGPSPMPILWFIWLVMMPAMTSAQAWLRLWRFMETELLKPVDRNTFLRDVFVLMLIDTVRAWLILAAGMVVSFSIISPSTDWRLVVQLLCASALVQSFMFGVTTWYMQYRSVGRLTVASMGAMVFTMAFGPVFMVPALADWRPLVVLLAVGLCVAGVVLTRKAGQRWQQVELG